MSKIVKSSTHSLRFANTNKQAQVRAFLTEYNRAIWWFVDYLWTTRIEWAGRILDVSHNRLDVPTFISTVDIDFPSTLSARAIKLASGEAIGIVKSQTAKRRRQLHVLSTKMSGGDVSSVRNLQKKIDSQPLIKPSRMRNSLFANLDSNCCKFIPEKTAEFDGYLKLHALGKSFGTIYLPIKFTRHSNKFQSADYELMTSWQIGLDAVHSRWCGESQVPLGNRIVGADQGLTTCLSLSDGQVTQKCRHGHDLSSIIADLGRKTKGSAGFRRAQNHRTNYINWSINQLNLFGVSELRLEKLFQMRKGVRTSAALNRWTYTQINAQIISRCEALGVRVVEQSATYRSQRCSECGWTHKPSRKGKEFTCTSCACVIDADVNGALNHEADLYRLPAGLWQQKLNKAGFFWTETGLFDSAGRELIVPDVDKVKT